MSYIDSLHLGGKDYGISQIRNEGVNNVTSLTDLPVDKRMIFATLSGDIDRITFQSGAEGMAEGEEIIIICNPTNPIIITFPSDSIKPVGGIPPIINCTPDNYFIIRLIKESTTPSFILDTTGEIPKLLSFKNDAEVGDIWFYNSLLRKDGFISPSDLDLIEDPKHKQFYKPLGICAIPFKHNVYGNGKVGVIGLAETKDSWGKIGVDTELPNYYLSPYIGNNGSITGDFVDFIAANETRIVKLPSDYYTGLVGLDGVSSYKVEDGEEYYSPSPYNRNGDRNLIYYKLKESGVNGEENELSDFNGKSNTDLLERLGEEYKAAKWCKRYSVPDTDKGKAGEWYLPGVGELGYVEVRRKKIESSINKLNSFFSVSYPIFKDELYWSSTEYGSSSPENGWGRTVNFLNGELNDVNDEVTKSNNIRPFIQVDPRQELPEFVEITFEIEPGDGIIRYSIDNQNYDYIVGNYTVDTMVLGEGKLGIDRLRNNGQGEDLIDTRFNINKLGFD